MDEGSTLYLAGFTVWGCIFPFCSVLPGEDACMQNVQLSKLSGTCEFSKCRLAAHSQSFFTDVSGLLLIPSA